MRVRTRVRVILRALRLHHKPEPTVRDLPRFRKSGADEFVFVYAIVVKSKKLNKPY